MAGTLKTTALLQLIRFDKPIGTLLLLWPTLIALWVAAEGLPEPRLLIIFILGTFLTRSAGCAVNDLADRKVDGSVERTSGRPLVSGNVNPQEALAFAMVLALLAFILVLFTNPLTIMLSFIAFGVAVLYPFMKRITNMPQLVLGLAFSFGVPMAFAATLDALPQGLWLWFLGNLLWTVVYDTQYAMVDRDDDIEIGVKSTAILFGRHDKIIIGALQVACMAMWASAGLVFSLGAPYWLALLAIAGLFIYHQVLIRDRDRDACFRAFLHNNRVGLVLFLGVALSYAI
ncbi:MAG: 4-hydroxybenzoate octaprenyltransferase [Pseudomonadota bacterium]